MIELPRCAATLQDEGLTKMLRQELQSIPADQLPLQQALQQSSYVSGNNFSVNVIKIESDAETVLAKVGIFYRGIIAGCSCADDPSPQDEVVEYCELALSLDRKSAACRVELLD